MQPINVLSLFDGCSGGNQALEMSGIKVANYYACEIDKYAIQVTQSNYPNTIQLGDVTKVNVKTLYLSEVYSYICNKYINNELYSLQSYISEQEMLHRINEEQAFSAYFGTQEQGKNSEVSTNTLLSINDRIWFWKYPMGGDKGVYDIIRSGSRRKVTNKIDVGVLCEYSFWWNGNGQYQSRIKEESFFGSNRIEKIGNNKTEDSRSSNKTIFNSSIERKSEIVSNRIIQRPIKKTKLFEWDGKCKHGAEVDKKEGNGRAKKASSICQNEGNIQANYEVNGVIEIDRVLVSIYSDVQVTIIECEWGIVIFKGVLELCCGGSPCQSFSFAGKRKGMSTKDNIEIYDLNHYLELKNQNFEFEGQSYLFWEYMRLLNELRIVNPDVKFLLENVEMGEKWEKVLSKAIGVNGIHINSALLTAQNRKRIYWTNIGMLQSGLFGHLESIIQQPKDKKIVLKDILENEVDEKYFLSQQRIETMLKSERSVTYADEETKKFNCLLAGYSKIPTDGQYVVHNTMPRSSTNGKVGTGHLSRKDGKTYCLDTGNTNAVEFTCVAMRGRGNDNLQQLEERNDNKTNCLTSVQKDNLVMSGDYRSDEGIRWRADNKTPTLMARARNDIYGPPIINTSRIRRLTPLECERLQGMKDNDFFCIFDLCLEKAKNYVNVVQKNLKLQKLVLSAEQDELRELVKNVYQNMSANHQSTKHIARQNVDIQTKKKTKKYKEKTLQENNIIANNAELGVMYNYQEEMEDFVQQNVFINIIEGKTIQCGMEESLQIGNNSINQKNGNLQLRLSGIEIMQVVEYVNAVTTKTNDTHSISTILYPSNIKNLEQILIIYYLFAKNVISGYTQNRTRKKNILLKFKITNGCTNFVSDSQRYKMIGNGWTIPVISHLFNYIK